MSKINILFFESIDSTSTYARQNAASLPLPSLIIANGQTAGRGRRGNTFFSPKDTGLYMTLVTEDPENSELLTPSAAVAVCKVLEKHGVEAKIKWVNDLFINRKKVCGILSERFLANGKSVISIGIGINLTTADFPEDLKSAGSINLECSKTALAEEISEALLYQINAADTVAEYRKRLFILGNEIGFIRDGTKYTAEAVDINELCNLIIRHPDGTTEALSSGEISIKI